ncbi:MAG: dephospho-CoA kinase [Candidatus Neomarinimicrobiota bacterium]
MLSIGLTGGLGSGKSLATKFFYEQGANILDADDIAKTLIEVKPELIEKIKLEFGDDCYIEGKLQKRVLAQRAFVSPESTAKLNSISHPALKDHLEKYIKAFKAIPGVLIVEAAVLLEAGFQDIFDKTILVTADKNIRVERAFARGDISEKSIQQRMALQMPEEEKRKLVDLVIENNGDEELLKMECLKIWNKLRALCIS